VIAKAVQEKDTTLTKKVCRERLAEVFGERVTENKAFVNEEVGRILGLTTGMPALSLFLSLSHTHSLALSIYIYHTHALSHTHTLSHSR
jgi:hypothetical protein